MAATKVAMSGSPPPDPILLGVPELSPDGKLAAMGVTFDEFRPRLVVLDIDREQLEVVDRPNNEGWLSPSFSPSGDRIAFIRYCAEGCAAGKKGFQVSLLDRKSGATTTVTEGSHLYRGSPLFSPDGQSIVFASKGIVWKEDFLARGLGWRHRGAHTTAGGGTLRMVDLKTGVERKILSDRFGVTQFSSLSPSGFLDENALIFTALGPAGSNLTKPDSSPLFRELERLVGRKDAKYRWYGYRLTLGKKLEFMSPDAPRRIGRVPSLSVSSDTGWMVFPGLSGRDPENPKFLGYDVFLGDGETFRPVTSLLTHMAHTAISKSGNRVAFLADDTRGKHWSLWVLDVETGQVRETSLKRRLHEWFRSLIITPALGRGVTVRNRGNGSQMQRWCGVMLRLCSRARLRPPLAKTPGDIHTMSLKRVGASGKVGVVQRARGMIS